MFERYTERARRVLFFARYEAGRAGSRSIQPEHLLLGLIRDGEGLSARVFERRHVSRDDLRTAVRDRTVVAKAIPKEDEIPFGAETEEVLRLAEEEANRFLHHHIGTEHLLLGILRGERSLAASILGERGMHTDAVRNDIVELLIGQPTTWQASEVKPDLPPSREVKIVLTKRRQHEGVSESQGSNFWTIEGLPLKEMLAKLHDIQTTRIELPAALDDDRRYDFLLVLPHEESRVTKRRLMREGIEKHFRIGVARETRPMDVYVLMAPGGSIAATKSSDDQPGAFGWMEVQTPAQVPDNFMGFTDLRFDVRGGEPPSEEELRQMPGELLKDFVEGWKRGVASIRGIVAGTTLPQLCETLEAALDRPVVDETNLTGRYELDIRTEADTSERFLQTLCDRLGLTVTTARRDVTMLVVRPA